MDDFCRRTGSHHLVITGFVASTPKGVPTTLKRNGSDFSASIFGRLLQSREIWIWTDVDGVYSADPRKVPEAECLEEISYEEAIELAYFGAKVIHPHTMGPAVDLNIPILIKNTFNPSAPGTYIHRILKHKDGRVARGFTTVDNVCLLNVEGTGMIGVPGIAQRLFGGLREVGVSVMLISQASSEHSICFAVPAGHADKAEESLKKVFTSELHHGQIERIQLIRECSILAMVGDNMVEKSGVAGRFFAALGNASVSVRAIAQGSSERNISVVVDQKDATRALRATHSAFFLSDYTISVGLIGPGIIGKALLQQLDERREVLKRDFKLDVRVRAIVDSKNMVLEPKQISSSVKAIALMDRTMTPPMDHPLKPTDLAQLAAHIQSEGIPHSVIIDCTSSEKAVENYADWLAKGIHIITPNKKAGSGSWERFQQIRQSQAKANTQFLYEATVGAGLPIIATLRDLIQTGDQIISIEGIFSGTLSFLFSEFNANNKFSDIVVSAKQKGFTEPDPRDDLNGMDVARKLVILAREAGFRMSMADVEVESLVPKILAEIPRSDEFMGRLPEMDALMSKRVQNADAQGVLLRYTGFVNAEGHAKVGLREFPKDHPFGRLRGTDNIIAFRTKRYDRQPLIVQGPGAGPEVTAGGIFADLLRLARALGARA
jgi:aspartokinase/homoserine dehydrogenase 1